MDIAHTQGRVGEATFVRLPPGTDLLAGITAACRRRGIRAGSIVSCIASLRRAAFFVVVPMDTPTGGGYSEPRRIEAPVEIVCGQGTVGEEETGEAYVHLHAALSDADGRLHGGHLIPGHCPVLITAEILILPLEGARLVRSHDDEAGLPLLKPFPPG
jgi:hypothetical protein